MEDGQSSGWDLDSDEIASVSSQDLHSHRPNRWHGPRSTWRSRTEEERLLWRSIRCLESRDLAIHLYDAFALKRRARERERAQGVERETVGSWLRLTNSPPLGPLTLVQEDGQPAVWAPPRIWTAWPLDERRVPKAEEESGQEDGEAGFAFRKPERQMPSFNLEHQLGAVILRLAKERFRRRVRKWNEAKPEGGVATEPEMDQNNSPSPHSSAIPSETAESAASEEADAERMELDSQSSDQVKDPNRDYEPTVATDDEQSYQLLRPSVRHILSQLDKTLAILHNCRLAGLGHLSDSRTDSSTDSSPGPEDATERSTYPLRSRTAPSTQGRKRARTADEGDDAGFYKWLAAGGLERRDQPAAEAHRPKPDNVGKKMKRWGLRNWGDVLGAAALAGFPEDVIHRTAKRCSALFGQGLLMRRLDEVPIFREPGFRTTEYLPEGIRRWQGAVASGAGPPSSSASSSPSSYSDEGPTLEQQRLASRQSSSGSTPSPRGRRSASASSSGSRSRSRSHSSGGLFFCPVASCPRAGIGFGRRMNLRRHVGSLHPGCRSDAISDDGTEEETFGAVHVDGFLQTIRPARGWRGGDATKRRSPVKRSARRRKEETDDDNEDEGRGRHDDGLRAPDLEA